jgi:hypothetical protein
MVKKTGVDGAGMAGGRGWYTWKVYVTGRVSPHGKKVEKWRMAPRAKKRVGESSACGAGKKKKNMGRGGRCEQAGALLWQNISKISA